MKVAFYTLGCKVNQYETQALETLFAQNGFEVVDFSDLSDVYIINTCTVTALSDKKSRNAARRAKRNNPTCILVVCGCYAQVEPDEVRALCDADIIVGSAQKGEILSLVNAALSGNCAHNELAPIKGRLSFEHLPAGGLLGRTRALLKVQDGCQNFCSYCKIPYARGVSRSIPLDLAVADAKKLAIDGFSELVITGIEISSYGFDLEDKPTLAMLISAVCNAAPNMRVRLGSLEPRTITEDFVREISVIPNLCHHFHLSLQSGCNKTLFSMNRKYDSYRYLKSCNLLKSSFSDCALTTDLIVGFPGETDIDFNESIDFIEKCGFYDIHIFPFSRRKGTKAYDMPEQLPKLIKEERAKRAADVVGVLKYNYLNSKISKTLSVLFEQETDGVTNGLSREYLPVFVTGEHLHNTVQNVKIISSDGQKLFGEIV